MTVTYSKVISSGQKGVFIRLLLMWKGSLYKLVYLDLLFYLSLYYALSLSYRLLLSESGRRTFEQVVHFANSVKNNIPLSFLLGFFVSGVINRWWSMFLEIPWMNRYAFLAQGIIAGPNATMARQIRLTMMRYLNLGWVLVMRKISDRIAKRFRPLGLKDQPERDVREMLTNLNTDPVVRLNFTKLITHSEIGAFERLAAQFKTTYGREYECEYWVPLVWAARLIKKAFVHGYIPDPRSMMYLLDEVDKMRSQMHTLVIYNDVMIPLVYTQVVIIAVYSYFLLQLFSAQFIRSPHTHEGGENRSCGCCQQDGGGGIDFFVPIFTIFQFLFLMGWLKVAMCVMNPFGDDDEDFQTSEILDYNLEISRRSASADDMMFPFDFKLPDLKTKSQPEAEGDNLPEFLARMSIEMERTRRELLVELGDPAGLQGGGGAGGVRCGGDWCCWGNKDESFVHSYSRDLVMDARPLQAMEYSRARRKRKNHHRRSGSAAGSSSGHDSPDEGSAFVAKNCYATAAAAEAAAEADTEAASGSVATDGRRSPFDWGLPVLNRDGRPV